VEATAVMNEITNKRKQRKRKSVIDEKAKMDSRSN
jgi:hypothetical protein